MSTPPAIPPVADSDRSVTYAPAGATTTLVDIPFPVYGDETDIEVYLDGAKLGTGFYGLASKSGVGVSALPQPLTDAQIFFSPAIAPNVLEVRGAIRPRQTVMPSAAQIGRREFNWTVGYVLSILREFWTKLASLTPVITINASGPIASRPAASSVANGYRYLQTDDASNRAIIWVSDGASTWAQVILSGPTGANGANGADGAPGASTATLRNRLINGNFAINQAGHTSSGALASGVYGHDGWKAGSGGCTYTFTPGTPDTQVTITAGSLKQIVEDTSVEGGSYVLSWTGTATGSINGGAAGASPRTIAGVTAGSAITVEFGTGTLGTVQLEPGSSASAFERRPYSVEMTLAQRYFRWVPVALSGQTGGGYQNTAPLSFPPMRATPTIGSAVADPSLSQSASNVSSYGISLVTKESAVAYATATVAGAFGVSGYRVALDARL